MVEPAGGRRVDRLSCRQRASGVRRRGEGVFPAAPGGRGEDCLGRQRRAGRAASPRERSHAMSTRRQTTSNIDLLLKPIGLADYTIVFARGRMVLAYLATDPLTPRDRRRWRFPASRCRSRTPLPTGIGCLLEPGVRISGSHPFLDPSGYRSHMIFQLAQTLYKRAESRQPADGALHDSSRCGRASRRQREDVGHGLQLPVHLRAQRGGGSEEQPGVSICPLSRPHRFVDRRQQPRLREGTGHHPGDCHSRRQITSLDSGNASGVGTHHPKEQPQSGERDRVREPAPGTDRDGGAHRCGPAPVTPAQVSPADYLRLPKSVQPLVKAGTVMPVASGFGAALKSL